MKSTKIAYLLWAVSIFGCLGLHQFYLKNTEKGILYILTFGGFGLSACYDFFTLSSQVQTANEQPNEDSFWTMKSLKEREAWVDLYQI
jgi:TM2 domain-containing membrane protein YozV